MKVQLESTTKIVELVTPAGNVPARIWEGHTEHGVACHAYITRIAVQKDDDATEFERDLKEHAPMSAQIAAIPTRLVL